MTEPQVLNYVRDPITGELVDPTTGVVVEDHPFYEHVAGRYAERLYEADDYERRAHYGKVSPESLHDAGLATYIDKRTALGRKLSKLQRMTRRRSSNTIELETLREIHRMAALLGLPNDVRSTACLIARKLLKSMSVGRGRHRYVAVASIIAAVKHHGIAMTSKEIERALGFDSPEEHRKVWETLSRIYSSNLARNRSSDPTMFLSKVVARLNLSPDVDALARRILERLRAKGYGMGRDPLGLAGGAVYVASILLNQRQPQRKLANAIGLAEPTIRNAYKLIVEKLTIEVSM